LFSVERVARSIGHLRLPPQLSAREVFAQLN